MVSKQEKILDYIRRMSPGTTFSIRSLAAQLQISEGTAYKAIKAAESTGLVATKSKVGSVRIAGCTGGIMASDLVQRLGLRVFCGENHLHFKPSRLMSACGSMEQIRKLLQECPPNSFCLCGDQPEIQTLALESGVHLLLTLGTIPSEAIVRLAQAKHLCILMSSQDASMLLASYDCLVGDRKGPTQQGTDAVRNWMCVPQYLFYNDYITDWYRFHQKELSQTLVQPVVEQDLSICGSISVEQATSAQMSQKIAQVYRRGPYPCTVSEDSSMQDVMEKMLATGSSCAFVETEGKLSGIVNIGDILRYSLYSSGSAGKPLDRYTKSMAEIDQNDEKQIVTYSVHLPDVTTETQISSSLLLPCLLAAAERHCKKAFNRNVNYSTGSFYALEENGLSGDVMIDSTIRRSSQTGCIIEAEMYDDTARYALVSLTLDFAPSEESDPGDKKE
jgi:predicted transcriptional regulator